MNKPLFFVANWKSYFSSNQAKAWIEEHHKKISLLAAKNYIALCPDATCIAYAVEKLSPLVKIGGQDCSVYTPGAHTGDISAQSLKEVGAQLCIIGHSETRKSQNDNAALVAQKAARLLEQNITPLICTGKDYQKDLTHILLHLKNSAQSISSCFFAFEPESAIGSDLLPSHEMLENAIKSIKELLTEALPNTNTTLLYGGSVSSKSIDLLKKIPKLDGFLLGRASLDFQELENIVSCSQQC